MIVVVKMTKIIFDIETTGLSALSSKITCISCKAIESEVMQTFYGPDEKKILEEFWAKVINSTELIGFNSDSFDIPFLIHRSLINRVRINKNFINKDLRKVINSFFISYNAKEKGTLNDWAKLLFNEEKETNGLECVEAAERGDYELIKKHCEQDVDLTFRLYIRLQECGLL